MAVMNSHGSSNDIAYFLDRLHDIRTEEIEARKKRLAGREMTAGSLGYSYKSGQENFNKFNYSKPANNLVIKPGKTKTK